MAVPSLILNLLIFWFIGSLIAGQRRRQQQTMTETKRRPPRRVRRGLTGPPYQEEDEEIETVTLEAASKVSEAVSSPGEEPEPQQRKTMAIATAAQEVTQDTSLTALSPGQPLEGTPALSSANLLASGTLVNSLILMQALSEPRCKRAWRAR